MEALQRAGPRRATGLTYLTILFVVAIMGVGLALVGEVWHTAQLQEREQDLLFAGNQFRKAILLYYEGTPGLPKKYPPSLHDLLKDERYPVARRYLRRVYPDPITGKDEWGIVKAPDGGVMGVHSLSQEQPLKSANFRQRDKDFEGAARYADWKFIYVPAVQAGKPGATSVSPVPASGVSQPGAPGTSSERPPVRVPREPWVCEGTRAADLRACEPAGASTVEEQEACRRRAADRYRSCIAG